MGKFTLKLTTLLLAMFVVSNAYAGDDYYHYVKVKSADSAKGLVYGSSEETDDLSAVEFNEEADTKFISEMVSETYVYASAKPAEGWVFSGWYKDEISADNFLSYAKDNAKIETESDNTDEYPVTPELTLVAAFSKLGINEQNLGMFINNGWDDYVIVDKNVSNSTMSVASANEGDEVVLSTEAKEEYANLVEFSHWTIVGTDEVVSTEKTLKVTAAAAAKTYIAVYKLISDKYYVYVKDHGYIRFTDGIGYFDTDIKEDYANDYLCSISMNENEKLNLCFGENNYVENITEGLLECSANQDEAGEITAETWSNASTFYTSDGEFEGIRIYSSEEGAEVGEGRHYLSSTTVDGENYCVGTAKDATADASEVYFVPAHQISAFNEVASSINEVSVAKPQTKYAIYSISGQKVTKPRAGWYIINGEKKFIK